MAQERIETILRNVILGLVLVAGVACFVMAIYLKVS